MLLYRSSTRWSISCLIVVCQSFGRSRTSLTSSSTPALFAGKTGPVAEAMIFPHQNNKIVTVITRERPGRLPPFLFLASFIHNKKRLLQYELHRLHIEELYFQHRSPFCATSTPGSLDCRPRSIPSQPPSILSIGGLLYLYTAVSSRLFLLLLQQRSCCYLHNRDKI